MAVIDVVGARKCNTPMNETLGTFTVREAARVVGLPEAQIWRWVAAGVLVPAFTDSSRWLGFRYALSFQDLVALRTLRKLRESSVSAKDLTRAAAFLKRNYGQPWSALRIGLDGRDVVFYEPETNDLISASHQGQKVAKELVHVDLLAEEIAASVQKARTRQPEQIGKTEHSKHVMSGSEVLAGTRIPVSTILDFYHAGYDADAIMTEFPDLYREDIDASIQYEARFGRQTA